ncbi:imidazolonepropionase [Gimibacter soli]|uniref:Imidazolonepropionase n=1 Tax=Gimibacter soli TaxID=3024400 RepID=A0AAE9XRV7_9PROT|nr:imidazolonepropionase [Gimibacter soli]WCL53815.1 imidazolonepropionase [Gimibacter soli]
MPVFDRLIRDVTLATMTGGGAPYGLIEQAAVGITDGRISFAGPGSAVPKDAITPETQVESQPGHLLAPGLIDCHTHLVFAGNRANEFEARLTGVSYADIAKAGGGIKASVAATRAASEDELVALALPRLARLKAGGVTTIEIKSGYGLTLEDELKMLRAAIRLEEETGVTVLTTLLAAHAMPPEYADRADAYVDHICAEIIPAAAELADAVDAYCETIAFSPEQVKRIFAHAIAEGMDVKLHADQLSNLEGGALAAEYGALSADHLEYLSDAGVAAMAEAGTVAVLLPGAFYNLREKTLPPVEKLRAAGVPMAIATDMNPGTSPVADLALMPHMACTLFGLTPEEALAGVTINAARALGIEDDRGSIEEGKAADLCLYPVSHPRDLVYWIGGVKPVKVIKDGEDF